VTDTLLAEQALHEILLETQLAMPTTLPTVLTTM
jgi:hypothetical protein